MSDLLPVRPLQHNSTQKVMWKIGLPTPGLEEQVVGTQVKQKRFCQKCAECVHSECIDLITKCALMLAASFPKCRLHILQL